MLPTIDAEFYLLSENADAFIARATLIKVAERQLDIQYYIIHDDASGDHLSHLLLEAADRGVKVRILVDDINLSGRDQGLKVFSQHPNIDIRIFNPFSFRDRLRHLELMVHLARAGRRMHNKVFICDQQTAIIGGRNIGDAYFDARHPVNLVDLDIMAHGAIVTAICHSFEEYWHSPWARPIEALSSLAVARHQLKTIRKRLRDRWHRAINSHYFRSLQRGQFSEAYSAHRINWSTAPCHLISDHPDKIITPPSTETIHLSPAARALIEGATSEVLIVTPYFVPGHDGVAWLQRLSQQGVTIKVITNSLSATDVPAVHAGYRRYRAALLTAGITLFELKSNSGLSRSRLYRWLKGGSRLTLHAKYLVVDGRFLLIGSANLDPRSHQLNTEIGLLIDSPPLAAELSALFNHTSTPSHSYRLRLSPQHLGEVLWEGREQGQLIHYRHEPNTRLWLRLWVRLLGLLPFESLL